MQKQIEVARTNGVAVSVTDGASRYNDRADVSIQATEALGMEATMAREFISRWGLVCAVPDGEDASGRQKVRLMTPQETVSNACEIASLATEEFRKRGWTVKVPTVSEAQDIIDANTSEL